MAGKHAVHGALPGVGVCNPCHNGLDTGTLEHYNRANARPGKDALRVPPGDVAFLGTYNAESGPAAFNPATRTCSNVICHGGQATPDWQTPDGQRDRRRQRLHKLSHLRHDPIQQLLLGKA